MDEKLIQRIDSLLEHINLVLKDTTSVEKQDLENSSLLLRATCFSLAQIGERMNKLEELLGNKYPNLPWKSARKMRNIIVHDYDNADIDMIYSTIKLDLPELKNDFEAIKLDLLK